MHTKVGAYRCTVNKMSHPLHVALDEVVEAHHVRLLESELDQVGQVLHHLGHHFHGCLGNGRRHLWNAHTHTHHVTKRLLVIFLLTKTHLSPTGLFSATITIGQQLYASTNKLKQSKGHQQVLDTR